MNLWLFLMKWWSYWILVGIFLERKKYLTMNIYCLSVWVWFQLSLLTMRLYTTNVKNMHLHRDSNPGPWNSVLAAMYEVPIFFSQKGIKNHENVQLSAPGII